MQQYDDALNAFREAIEGAPTYIAPRLGRAKIRLLRREYALAIEELEATKALAPDDPTVWRDIGKAHLVMRKPLLAVSSLETAIRLDPDDGEAHYLFGKAHFDLGKAGPATDRLLRASQLGKPEDSWLVDAFLQLGYAARTAGRNPIRIGSISAVL